MEIKMIRVEDLKPYENNPRFNDDAVKYVANSIKEFGFKVPIVVDKDNVIVAGHTRYKASLELDLKEVPCIVADDLNEKQIKAFRIADNKTNDLASWNNDLLSIELDDILKDFDMTEFGFGDFELSMLTEDMEPDEYDEELIEKYSSDADEFLAKKRIIITYATPEETQFLKNLIKEDSEELGVVYKIEDIMEKFDE